MSQATDPKNQPHAFVPRDHPTFKTCALCGFGEHVPIHASTMTADLAACKETNS